MLISKTWGLGVSLIVAFGMAANGMAWQTGAKPTCEYNTHIYDACDAMNRNDGKAYSIGMAVSHLLAASKLATDPESQRTLLAAIDTITDKRTERDGNGPKQKVLTEVVQKVGATLGAESSALDRHYTGSYVLAELLIKTMLFGTNGADIQMGSGDSTLTKQDLIEAIATYLADPRSANYDPMVSRVVNGASAVKFTNTSVLRKPADLTGGNFVQQMQELGAIFRRSNFPLTVKVVPYGKDVVTTVSVFGFQKYAYMDVWVRQVLGARVGDKVVRNLRGDLQVLAERAAGTRYGISVLAPATGVAAKFMAAAEGWLQERLSFAAGSGSEAAAQDVLGIVKNINAMRVQSKVKNLILDLRKLDGDYATRVDAELKNGKSLEELISDLLSAGPEQVRHGDRILATLQEYKGKIDDIAASLAKFVTYYTDKMNALKALREAQGVGTMAQASDRALQVISELQKYARTLGYSVRLVADSRLLKVGVGVMAAFHLIDTYDRIRRATTAEEEAKAISFGASAFVTDALYFIPATLPYVLAADLVLGGVSFGLEATIGYKLPFYSSQSLMRWAMDLIIENSVGSLREAVDDYGLIDRTAKRLSLPQLMNEKGVVNDGDVYGAPDPKKLKPGDDPSAKVVVGQGLNGLSRDLTKFQNKEISAADLGASLDRYEQHLKLLAALNVAAMRIISDSSRQDKSAIIENYLQNLQSQWYSQDNPNQSYLGQAVDIVDQVAAALSPPAPDKK